MENIEHKLAKQETFLKGPLFWVIIIFFVALLSYFGGYYMGGRTVNRIQLTNTQQKKINKNLSKNVSNINKTANVDPKVQQLIAVAKNVFWQEPYDQYTGYALGFCQFGKTCPFTKQLYENFANEHNPPGDWGAWFAPGFQNGPFGTLSYLAIPSNVGGTVYITLIPTESYIKNPGGDGENSLLWTLTLLNVNGVLLVNNITYEQGPSYGNSVYASKPCGPVNLYDYISACH